MIQVYSNRMYLSNCQKTRKEVTLMTTKFWSESETAATSMGTSECWPDE